MNTCRAYFHDLGRTLLHGWNDFWFTPSDPATLCLMRILTGLMLCYTHLVWSVDLVGFFGPDGLLTSDFVRQMHEGSPWAWSHLHRFHSTGALWILHSLALLILVLFTIGFATRCTAWLAFLITVSYAHRAEGALFGLDQINGFLALYLAIGPSGARYSWDAWWRGRGQRRGSAEFDPSVGANIALRLTQTHMCIVYLFAGLGKLLGPSWWAGIALWGAFANYEYQTWDMTWLARHPLLVNLMTQTILVWEVSYSALIWPRLTRPLVLALAVPLHLGIAICMGMTTFGLVMLIGNMAFISPDAIRYLLRSLGLTHEGTTGVQKAGHQLVA
jgi:hypothetical protein